VSDLHNQRFQLDRLAFFSDAVFAIAITLLVIEIHVPEVEDSAALGQALLGLIPKYIGFAISFFVVGRFWLGHHRVFGLLSRCDDRLIGRNLLLLMAIAFGPFPTALISEYTNASVAVFVYAGWLVTTGLLSRRLSGYVIKTPALWAAGVDGAVFERLRWGSWTPIIAGLLAAAMGAIQPALAVVPLMASPLIGLITTRLAARRMPAVSAS
jgi:uncharacterized membrane protein